MELHRELSGSAAVNSPLVDLSGRTRATTAGEVVLLAVAHVGLARRDLG